MSTLRRSSRRSSSINNSSLRATQQALNLRDSDEMKSKTRRGRKRTNSCSSVASLEPRRKYSKKAVLPHLGRHARSRSREKNAKKTQENDSLSINKDSKVIKARESARKKQKERTVKTLQKKRLHMVQENAPVASRRRGRSRVAETALLQTTRRGDTSKDKETKKTGKVSSRGSTQASKSPRKRNIAKQKTKTKKNVCRERKRKIVELGPLPSSMKELKKYTLQMRDDLSVLQNSLQETIEEHSSAITAMQDNMKLARSKLVSDHDAFVKKLHEEITENKSCIHDLTKKNTELEVTSSKSKNEAITANNAANDAKKLQKLAESNCAQLEERVQNLEKSLDAEKIGRSDDKTKADSEISFLQNELLNAEKLRRQLHNTIQELKGNIRVFCRIRPIINGESSESQFHKSDNTFEDVAAIEFPPNSVEDTELTINGVEEASAIGGKSNRKVWNFSFDKVLRPTASQEVVFEEIGQLVQSALDGYNVCIFAYGQTGSGKTYTMEGGADKNRGMIPRAVEKVFSGAENLRKEGWSFELRASHVEIYNETLRDLLVGHVGGDTATPIKSSTVKANREGTAKSSKKNRRMSIAPKSNRRQSIMPSKNRRKSMVGTSANSASLTIHHHPRNGTTKVSGLTEFVVTSPEDVSSLLTTAHKNRATAATKSNSQSSRSHSVFILTLIGSREGSGEQRRACLHLVDLAGSERLSKSKAEGARLKETQAINKSLSAIGDVIFALSNKDRHVPFRNSKLTWLLKNSIGGNSKVLMFVNIPPTISCIDETLCSLRFARKVNSCDIKTAKRNTKLKRSQSAGFN